MIDNGFARTEVTQTFDNPSAGAVEARYSLPLSAALSEMTVVTGTQTLYGVGRKQTAQLALR